MQFLNTLHRVSREVARYLEEQGLPAELNATEGHVIAYLAVYSPVTVGRLNSVFGLRPSTLTSILNRLEEKKLVTRKVHPRDHRAQLLELTREGAIIAEQMHSLFGVVEARILSFTSEDEVEGFQSVMHAISQLANGKQSPGDVG